MVARGLGVREFGYFTFSIAFIQLFLIFGKGAIDGTLVSEMARERERLSDFFVNGLVLRVGVALVSLSVAFAVAPVFVKGPKAYVALVIIGSALLLDEVSSFLGVVFKAFERMQFLALAVLVNRVLSTALAALALASGGGLALICFTYFLGSLGALAAGAVFLVRRFPPIDFSLASGTAQRRLFRLGLPLGIAGGLNMAVFRIDTVMLQGIRGAFDVAMYGAAYRVFESTLFVAYALANVALPRMSRALRPADAMRTFERTGALMLAFYMPVAAGAPFAGTWLIVTLFSDKYAQAGSILWILLVAGLFYAFAHLSRMTLIAFRTLSRVAFIALIVLIANVTMNVVAIPRYGFTGAAWTTLITAILEATLLLTLVVRAASRPALRVMAIPMAASAIMVASLVLTGVRDAQAVVLGTAVYLVALAAVAPLLAPAAVRTLRGAFVHRIAADR